MEQGYLTVIARTASGLYPVEGARISVYAADSDILLHELYTDEAGISPKLALDAPPRSNADSPDGGDPYAYYDLRVEKIGFYPISDLSLPIASGTTSLQRVEMIPQGSGTLPPEGLLKIEEGGRR
ncbi:MAG: hypothetical protein E7655_09070 [Ruminococcaceae bacterium]|nr:hypothetical protein [Oscillospiraceae bacterium]